MLSNPAQALKTTVTSKLEQLSHDVFARAGIELGGSAPHDIEVVDRRFHARVLRDGSLGLGEAYVEGWWESRALDVTITRMLDARLDERGKKSVAAAAHAALTRIVNMQTVRRAFEVGERHYDIGNDLYEAMLDARLLYTCAYWQRADTLDDAQVAKLELVCQKIGLERGMKVLDLGCGWGGFARYAAETYGAEVTGYTVSSEQADLARERCAGLPVTIFLEDYRQAHGQFDRVVSIGLMEHVGYKNYRGYMELAERCLAPGGFGFVHTIGGNESRTGVEPWFDRYIFPNAVIPSMAQLSRAMEKRMVIEDLHNIGPHYDRTLMAWNERFEAAWPKLAPKYGERFRRMWRFYLLASAAAFRARHLQLFQLVFTPMGTKQPDCRKS
ncbi:MAG TPA: cyclopropane fatty acyl phospholipid synthase [Kofleriaceae bacterium]|nr:cyclopropane fatty acyl phospholipid synthase [Kofleriaceae bacterium]